MYRVQCQGSGALQRGQMIRVTQLLHFKLIHVDFFAREQPHGWCGSYSVQMSVESAQDLIAQLQAAVEAVKGGDDD